MVQMPNCYINHNYRYKLDFIEEEYAFKYIYKINMPKPLIYRIFGIEINF